MIWTYFKLAWRNLFRNKRRSFIAGTAIAIGLASLIFTDALWNGIEENMIYSATASFVGEGQIHRSGFRESRDAADTLLNARAVISQLSNEPDVESLTSRVYSFGMISSAANVTSTMMVGVRPSTEGLLSQVDDAIVKGSFFDGDSERDILIGDKLAEILEVDLGDRVVVTVAQAESEALSQEMFRVSGIYHFNISEMDRGTAFVRIRKAQKMLGLGTGIHEIVLKFKDSSYGKDPSLPFWRKYSSNGNEALPWTSLLPELNAALSLSNFSTLIVALMLLGIVALGIINTLFMSLYERMFEFGVLRAIGTRPLDMAKLIVFEAASLAVVSAVLGSVLGFGVTLYLSHVGIDYTGIEFGGVTFRELIRPVLEVEQFIVYPLGVLVMTALVGVYPALYAARFSPAYAMRRSL